MPADLYLSNTTLSGTYEAQNSITVEDNVTVTGTTTLKAGNNIHLKPGFTAPSGIDFTAKIGTVTNVAKRFYYLKDHLGSVRVTVDEAGEIVSSDDYDPWGMILNGRSTDGSYLNAKYKFTGKELDTETGYFHFGARYYDGRIGRWLQVDPLFEKHPEWSPYNYVLNNPLILIDPDGRQVFFGSSALYARPQIYFRGNWRLFPNQRYQDVPKPKVSLQRYVEPKPVWEPIPVAKPSVWKHVIDFIFDWFGSPKPWPAIVPPASDTNSKEDETSNNNNEDTDRSEDNKRDEQKKEDKKREDKKEEDKKDNDKKDSPKMDENGWIWI